MILLLVIVAAMMLPLMPSEASVSENGQTCTAGKCQIAVPVEVTVSPCVLVYAAKVDGWPTKEVRSRKPARKIAKAVLKLPRRVARRLVRRGG